MSEPFHVPMSHGCVWANERIAELEADLARHTETALDTNEALYKAEAEAERARVAEGEAMSVLEGTELKLAQAEAEQSRLAELEADLAKALALFDEMTAIARERQAEVERLNSRRCDTCTDDGVCEVARAAWRKFEVAQFSCACWRAEEETP